MAFSVLSMLSMVLSEKEKASFVPITHVAFSQIKCHFKGNWNQFKKPTQLQLLRINWKMTLLSIWLTGIGKRSSGPKTIQKPCFWLWTCVDCKLSK